MIHCFSFTRDRLELTKVCFKSLQDNAGTPFLHWILDNGSEDGTREWLETVYKRVYTNIQPIVYPPTNVGIPKAMNMMKQIVTGTPGDLVIKVDNDCFVTTPNLLHAISCIYGHLVDPQNWVLSPRVEGINHQPGRSQKVSVQQHPIGMTCIVGGLFRAMTYENFMSYEADETLPKAFGTDGHLAQWWLSYPLHVMGYIEDLVVQHYPSTNEQSSMYPSYFARKRIEEGRA